MKIPALLLGSAWSSIAIIDEPLPVRAIVGETVTLPCAVDGLPSKDKNSVQWLKGSTAKGYFALGFPPLGIERFTQKAGENKDYSLIIDDVQIEDEATFECQVTKHQLRSRQAHLTVLQPPQDVSMFPVSDGRSGRWPELDEQEGVLSVVEDEITKLRCVASSSKPATVLDWSISGASKNGTDSISGEVVKTTVSEMTFKAKKDDHQKFVTCKGRNDALDEPVIREVVLNVLSKPSISVELSSDSTAEGDDVTASCRTSANPPVVASDILWTVGGVRVENASGPTLQLNSVTSDMDLQLVECRARNSIGTSSSATPLRVTYAPKAINSSPERIVHDQLERAALKCEFAGNPKPEITWFRSHNQETQIGSGDFLEILELASSHAGEYICKAESVLGKAVSSVTLAVRGPPVITSQTVQTGDTLECAFIAEPEPILVQIRDVAVTDQREALVFKGTPEDFKNSQLSLNLERGQYECVVGNELGQVSKLINLKETGLPLEVILGTVIAVALLLAVAGAALWLRLRSMTRGQCYKAADWAGASKHSSGGAGHHHSRKDDNFATEISCPHLIRESSTKSVNEIQSTSSHQSKKITSVQGSRAGHAHQSGSAIHDDGYGTESGSNNKNSEDSSQSESNSDYEVLVCTLNQSVSTGSEQIRVVFEGSDPSNVNATYFPENLRSQAAKLRQKQLINNQRPKARSVSQV